MDASSLKIDIFNGDCFDYMAMMPIGGIDIILTSPPYNSNKKQGKNGRVKNRSDKTFATDRYDKAIDNMTTDEYRLFTETLFHEFGRILAPNGTVVYNISYGAENTSEMFLAIADVVSKTDFTIADVMYWQKNCAMPDNQSHNRLTRIIEPVFIFCRKDEIKTYNCNKEKTSTRSTGQQMFAPVFNLMFAKNNDGICPLNRCTYSVEFCKKMLSLYAPAGCTVFDPFCGTGTTGVACKHLGLTFLGSEISKAQCEYSIKRIKSCDGEHSIEKKWIQESFL